MYVPTHFAEDRLEILHQLIQAHPLGTLVTLEQDGMNANHLPFEIAAPSADAPFGILRAHIARSNPLWKNLDTSTEALIVFQGPQAYITPSWYEEKKHSGKVVPTFNYAVVHAHGNLRVVDDAQWLLCLLHRLTGQHESKRASPWHVSDAPEDYLKKMLAAIIGIEISLTRLNGKWKVSQNRPQQDRLNIAAGLREGADQNAMAMAALVMPTDTR
ncbi:MAG: FMN-binding negative transcriptional regulator [Undibacterium sp.]|nr:FMN-binding negative transcriptional regulator [Undibacterium sp.]